MDQRRVVIAGGPKSGKTTLAEDFSPHGWVRHTDELIDDYEWSEQSELVAADWFTEPGPWVIEGTAAIRALRKALAMRPEAPCDILIWINEPRVERNVGQESMAKSCNTIFEQIKDELKRRGVVIKSRLTEP